MTLKSNNRAFPVSCWPAKDQAAWRIALQPAHPLDLSTGLASRWRPATTKGVENGYGRWLNWLDQNGRLAPELEPGQRVNRESFRLYLDSLEAQGGMSKASIGCRIGQVGAAMIAMAQEGDWRWVGRGSARLRSGRQTSPKQIARMQPAGEVLQLGLDLMVAAKSGLFRTEGCRASAFRDGLMIAFLIHRPFRRANLAKLTLGVHLEKRGDFWRLYLPSEETKTGNSVDTEWPASLSEHLETYLEIHREVLMRSTPSRQPRRRTDALWISKLGREMNPSSIYFQISARTQAAFGVAINPHSFRHIVATAIATNNPSGATDIMSVLGHKDLGVSEKYYNRAQMQAAGQSLHNTIAALRKGI